MQLYCTHRCDTVAGMTPDVKPRVPYRQRQAEETRRRIVAAARRLFAERGYAATSIEAVAEDVGVAVRTVYAAFGNKIAILGAICDEWLSDANVITLVMAAADAPDPRQVLGLLAQAARQQWESGGDILDMTQAAAAVDSKIATLLRGWAGDREKGMGMAVKRISPQLRRGMDTRRANAVVRALTAPAVYLSLVSDSGWTAQQYQQWLEEILVEQLLAR
jgi:AcrR family transcriptional regulator